MSDTVFIINISLLVVFLIFIYLNEWKEEGV